MERGVLCASPMCNTSQGATPSSARIVRTTPRDITHKPKTKNSHRQTRSFDKNPFTRSILISLHSPSVLFAFPSEAVHVPPFKPTPLHRTGECDMHEKRNVCSARRCRPWICL